MSAPSVGPVSRPASSRPAASSPRSPFGRVAAGLALLALLLAGPPAAAQVRGPADHEPPPDPVQERLRGRLEPLALEPDRVPPAGIRAAGVRLARAVSVARFYAERGFRPAWSEEDRPVSAARSAADALGEAASHGLPPEAYHRAEIDRLLGRSTGPDASPDSLAALELLLTDAYLRIADHLQGGLLDPAEVDPDWSGLRRPGRDPSEVLGAALASGRPAAALRELPPGAPGYDALRRALRRHRAVAESGGWPPVPPGPTLHPDDRGERVAALWRRLAESGDLPPEAAESTPEPELFDRDLERAVRRFQRRHGLEVDGVVGERTLAALNVPAAERARQIEANLERWRWMSGELGSRHLLVNIADFRVELVEADSTVLESRAIVGRTYRQTPVFSDTVRYLVLNPSWNVPHGIATLDILPQVKEDPSYLERQGMAVYRGWAAGAEPVDPSTVDWASLGRGNFPYRLVQRPGPLNALGRVKFMFPNRFNVYLHDTPARGLFARNVRSFSSGCIRVERSMELAERLLAGPGTGWTADSLAAAVRAARERTVVLSEPVPVHIQYWTAWAESDGEVHFREDVYGRDRALTEAFGRAAPDPR